jgi:hypothetical protein
MANEKDKQSTALVLVIAPPVVTVPPEDLRDLGFSDGSIEEPIWLTYDKDTAKIKKQELLNQYERDVKAGRPVGDRPKGCSDKIVVLFAWLRAFYEIPGRGELVMLGTISRLSGFAEEELVKGLLSRAIQQMNRFGIPCTLKKDRSRRDKKAKRGNPIIGVTFDPIRDAKVETLRNIREGQVSTLALLVAQKALNDKNNK